jgi:hypothetical protein
MANYFADLLYSPINSIKQRVALKTLSKTFQLEIKAMYEENLLLAELCK